MIKIKKVAKISELNWMFGVVIVALGVAFCSKADLGVSMIAAPAFVLYDAVKAFWSGFSVGMLEYIFEGVLLLILCIIIKKITLKYLLSFTVAIIYGYMLDLFLLILQNVTLSDVWMRYTALILGDILTAFGVACFFRTYMPLQVYELFVSEFSKHFKLSINKVKWSFDISLLIISITLAVSLLSDFKTFDWAQIYCKSFHNIGLGTLITTVINSPLIAFFGKILDKFFEPAPLFPKLESALKK